MDLSFNTCTRMVELAIKGDKDSRVTMSPQLARVFGFELHDFLETGNYRSASLVDLNNVHGIYV